MSPQLERLRRIAYSCFIVTNLVVIGYCNLPHAIGNRISHELQLLQDHYYTVAADASARLDHAGYEQGRAQWDRFIGFRNAVAWCDRKLRLYAHYVGLDNRWQMFGRQSRFNWWYVFKGHYTDGERAEELVLDLPRQSPQSGVPRTFWQYHFFDFREGKFHLNMYNDPLARAAYARYLARTYPRHEGLPIDSIEIELHYQNIKSPEEARRTGSHLYDETHHYTYNQFSARGELEPRRTLYSLPPLPQSPPSNQDASARDEQDPSPTTGES